MTTPKDIVREYKAILRKTPRANPGDVAWEVAKKLRARPSEVAQAILDYENGRC